MPHVRFVTLSGFRVHQPRLLELGMSLPGFHDRARALQELPALGLITLAGMLPEKWTCDYFAPEQVDEETVEELATGKPDLLAISALTASIGEAYLLSQQLRSRGVQTVLGGLHVSASPDEAEQFADSVVVGSGEPVWLDVLRDADHRTLKPRYTAPRSNPSKSWPVPRFDLLGEVNRFTIQTQRGCPFACDFCAASRMLETFREKPAKNLREELESIEGLRSVPLVELADDNTFAGSRDTQEFFDVLEDANIRWFTESDWRIGERPEILDRLASSGCVQVLIGLESIVFRYPGMAEKAVELQRMVDACHAIQESGVCVNACFISGADGETPESLERLTEFLMQCEFAEIQVTLQTPFPGTALARRLSREGRLLKDRGWPYYTLFEVTHQPDLMSVAELEKRYEEVIKNVYSAEATRRRKKLRKQVWSRNRNFSRKVISN